MQPPVWFHLVLLAAAGLVVFLVLHSAVWALAVGTAAALVEVLLGLGRDRWGRS